MKNSSYLTKFFFEYFNPSSHYLINNTMPFKQQNENNYEQFLKIQVWLDKSSFKNNNKKYLILSV